MTSLIAIWEDKALLKPRSYSLISLKEMETLAFRARFTFLGFALAGGLGVM